MGRGCAAYLGSWVAAYLGPGRTARSAAEATVRPICQAPESSPSSASMRSFATARDTVLFTVPRLIPSAAAISGSVMSSKYLSMTVVRIRCGSRSSARRTTSAISLSRAWSATALVRELAGGELLDPAAAPPRYMGIDHRPPDIGVERGVIVDLAPGQVGLGQGRLHEVFCVGPVPGQHGGHPQQRGPPGEDVITERGILVAGSRFIVIAGAAHADYLT